MTATPPSSVLFPRSSDVVVGKSLLQLGMYGEGTRRWKDAVERQTQLHLVWVYGIYEMVKSELGPRQWIISGDEDTGSNWISILTDADRCRHTRLEFASILERQNNAGNTAMPQQQSTKSSITPTLKDVCFDDSNWPGTIKYREVIKSLVSTSNSTIWSDALNRILLQSIKGRFLILANKVWGLANEEEIYEKAAPCYKRYRKLDNPPEGDAKKARTSSTHDKKKPARKTRGLRNEVKIDKLTETYISALKALKVEASKSNDPEVHDEGTKILNLIMQVKQARVKHGI
jgi:hypothetical protein